MLVSCPSGLTGEIRKLKVLEENLLADRKKLRNGSAIAGALAGIWQRTESPGPYTPKPDGGIDWGQTLVGDHLYATISMRIATYGPSFTFRTQCTNMSCRAPFDWEIDLKKIPVQKLSDESLALFTNGNRFEAALADERKVYFKLLIASEAQRGLNWIRRDQADHMVTASLRLQIIEIAGGEKKEINDFLDNLDSDQADKLRAAFDAAGCGLETTAEIECPDCGCIDEVEIPFAGDRGFFSPRKKKARSNSS